MAEVVLEKVGKRYPNGVQALRGFSLTVANGERIALVGPSGSGKSTALRLIAGLGELTAGTVRIGGRDMNGVPARERNVAMVFQRPTFFPHLNVRDNLAFAYRLRKVHGRVRSWLGRLFSSAEREEQARGAQELEARIEEVAGWLELRDLLDRFPGQLSGGQQQRVALGRALIRRPAVYLLDEPLSNLEPRLRTDLRRQLHLLQQRLPATMIYVTHDQTEALTFGERVAVLDGGVIQQVDRPAVLYQRPSNRFVAEFIGWPTMSFARGQVRDDGSQMFLRGDDWALALPASHAVNWKDGTMLELGIRPEHVSLARESERTLAMNVELVEPLGGNTLVSCRRGSLQLAALVPARATPSVGEMVPVRLDMNRIFLFDVVNGLTLSVPTE